MTNEYFTKAFHASNPASRKKGVSILIGKNSGFELNQQLADPEGRFLLLRGSIGKIPITIANVYFSNTAHVSFCQKLIDELSWFATDCIVLGGNYIPLDLLQDTSNGKLALSYRILKKIKSLLNSLTLRDSWPVAHPQDRDYTYYSTVHSKNSRIIYMFVTQRDLTKLTDAHIGIRTVSDHATISMSLRLQDTPKKPCN